MGKILLAVALLIVIVVATSGPSQAFMDACKRVQGAVVFDGRQYQCIKGADRGAP